MPILHLSDTHLTPQHEALVAHLCLERGYVDLKVAERVLYATPFTFDISWGLVWTTLTYGAQLCIAKPDALLDPSYMQEFLFSNNTAHANFVPTPLSVYMEACDGALPPSLRILYVAGEALGATLARAILEALPRGSLFNVYGPCEAYVTHMFKCSNGDSCNFATSVPIGKPVPNLHAYILDHNRMPVPAGIAGQHAAQLGIGDVGAGFGGVAV